MTLISQEQKKNLNQKAFPKVKADGKLVGEINPDNFTYESDLIPKVKTEIKQEYSDELPLLVTNDQSLNDTPKSKEEAENGANKLQSDGSNTISDPENAPIRHGHKKYGCPFCPKLTRIKSNMKLHIRSHTGEKLFSCNDCEKSFTHKGDLARHTLIHTGEQPFECNDCEKRKCYKPYKCEYCPNHYLTEKEKEKHERENHMRTIIDNMLKKY